MDLLHGLSEPNVHDRRGAWFRIAPSLSNFWTCFLSLPLKRQVLDWDDAFVELGIS